MLISLHIENMAVISRMDVDLGGGLSVFTGETGSGKSVMIESLLFLLGGKPPRELVRSGEERALVAGVFGEIGGELSAYLSDAGLTCGEELLLQRTLTQDGKTQCRLDGRVIPQGLLREISRRLVNIHGQNDNQILLSRHSQGKILDACAHLERELLQYREEFEVYGDLQRQLEELHKDSAQKERMRDMLRFQIAEIDGAHLKPGEEEVLLARRNKLQNAEKISRQSEFAYRVLYGSEKGAAALIDRAAQSVGALSSVVPEAGELAERLSSMRYEVEDIANTVREFSADTEGDPTAALNRVEERLDTISRLCRKYGADVGEVLRFREEAATSLSALDHSAETEETLMKSRKDCEQRLRQLADGLHTQRTAAAKELSDKIREELAFLDMPGVRFDIRVFDVGQFGPGGTDSVEFLLSANPGEPLLPLERVASGGELARVMLTLQSVLNRRDGVGTAVFDEIDTGISGKTARKIGIKLAAIGKETQVICVTHSAQIASLAGAHYKISKHEENARTCTVVQRLSNGERVEEVARILGGLSVTQTQLDAAAEMIEEGRAYR